MTDIEIRLLRLEKVILYLMDRTHTSSYTNEIADEIAKIRKSFVVHNQENEFEPKSEFNDY